MKVKDLLNHMCLWSDVEVVVQLYPKDSGVPSRYTVNKYEMRDQYYGEFGNAKVSSFGIRGDKMIVFGEKG